MDISVFLAKIVGLYLGIIALAMLIHGKSFRKRIPEMSTPAFTFVGGAMALLLGLLIVISHNIWVADWPVLITILGWMTLIKGVVRLLISKASNKINKVYAKNSAVYYVTVVILLVIGAYLSFMGFTVTSP